MAFRELGGSQGNVLKWTTPGQVVEGRLVGTKRGKVFNNRPTTLAIIQGRDGVQITIPLTTVLENRFIENSVQPGATVRITFLGMAAGSNGGPQYKNFRLEVDDATVGQPMPPAVVPQQAPAPVAYAVPPVVQPPVAVPSVAQPAPVPAAPASEYDQLAAKLTERVGAASAGPMLNALATMYPDPAVRTEQLKVALRSQGVAV